MTTDTATEPTTITAPGIYEDLDFLAYLADPVPTGSLSSTFARLLTKHVPAKAIAQRTSSTPTRAMTLGTAAHLQALGTGPQLIVWEHDGRTRDGKAERVDAADLIGSGAAIALTARERDQVVGMGAALRAHQAVAEILESSRAEVSAFWQESGVWLRARYDLLGETDVYDYKTAQDVSPRGFSRAMASYGYHQQAEFYERGLAALDHSARRGQMRFICQETEPPFLVQIHTPDVEACEVAKLLNDRAIGLFAECTATGHWPEYSTLTAEPVALPSFYFFDNAEVLPDNWRPLEQDMVVPS